jgi:hypothetical protein
MRQSIHTLREDEVRRGYPAMKLLRPIDSLSQIGVTTWAHLQSTDCRGLPTEDVGRPHNDSMAGYFFIAKSPFHSTLYVVGDVNIPV